MGGFVCFGVEWTLQYLVYGDPSVNDSMQFSQIYIFRKVRIASHTWLLINCSHIQFKRSNQEAAHNLRMHNLGVRNAASLMELYLYVQVFCFVTPRHSHVVSRIDTFQNRNNSSAYCFDRQNITTSILFKPISHSAVMCQHDCPYIFMCKSQPFEQIFVQTTHLKKYFVFVLIQR